jgi:hypothetical protein
MISGRMRCSISVRNVGNSALAIVICQATYDQHSMLFGPFQEMHTFVRLVCEACSGMFHFDGKSIVGESAF